MTRRAHRIPPGRRAPDLMAPMTGHAAGPLAFLAKHRVDAAAHLPLRLGVARLASCGRQALFVGGRGRLVAGDALKAAVARGLQRRRVHVDRRGAPGSGRTALEVGVAVAGQAVLGGRERFCRAGGKGPRQEKEGKEREGAPRAFPAKYTARRSAHFFIWHLLQFAWSFTVKAVLPS